MSLQPTPADLKDLRRIVAAGTTPYVDSLIRKEIARLEEMFPEEKRAPAKPAAPRVTWKPIESYAFSDSKDYAQVIVREIQSLDQAEITFEPQPEGFTIMVDRSKQNLPNMKLTVNPVYEEIIPGESSYRVRGETLTIKLAKKEKTTWMKLKKSGIDFKKDTKKDDAKEDPNNALMNMMKKMYDEGDDEMKRTIQKAMWEAQHKKPDEKPSFE